MKMKSWTWRNGCFYHGSLLIWIAFEKSEFFSIFKKYRDFVVVVLILVAVSVVDAVSIVVVVVVAVVVAVVVIAKEQSHLRSGLDL